MRTPKTKSVSTIQYYLITSDDTSNYIVSPQELKGILEELRHYPRDIIQLNHSIEYFETSISNQLYFGLDLFILSGNLLVKDTSGKILSQFTELFGNENHVKIFFIDASLEKTEDLLKMIETVSGINYISSFNDSNKVVKNLNKSSTYFSDVFELFLVLQRDNDKIKNQFKQFSTNYQDLNWEIKAEDNFKELDKYQYFQPCVSNYFTLNQITRYYWGREEHEINIENAKKASNSMRIEDRPNLILEKTRKIDYLVHLLYSNKIARRVNHYDNYYETIILIFPFRNPRFAKKVDTHSLDNRQSIVVKLISMEQNAHYQNIPDIPDKIEEKIVHEVLPFLVQLDQERLLFLDSVGYLHATFKYSPVMRFPILGKSINKELGFFKPESRTFTKSNPTKTIWKFGAKLSEYLSISTKEYIAKRNGQIFVISDLPVEWLLIEDAPLIFTHDVCRLPEGNYRSLLNNYIINQRYSHTVSEDIMKNTLVVFGASKKHGEDEAFKKWYDEVEKLKEKLGFNTVHCSNIEDVKNAVYTFRPELLIFDCHGGFEEKTLSSYLYINNQKLTGEYIIKNKISAPIVFLSACNTSPNYGYSNLIGEAFFQAGATTVTSTFLPIGIHSGSILYIRLLEQLSIAAKKAFHQNWLSFVAHIIRTSIVQEVYRRAWITLTDKKTEFNAKTEKDRLALILSNLMFFEKRKDIYNQISKENYFGIKLGIENLSNEYLHYTHLGRADLVMFDIWQKQRANENQ